MLTQQNRSNRVAFGLLTVFLLGMLYVSVQVRPSILQFHVSLYALPSFIAFCANIALIFLISRMRVKVMATYWYMVFLACLALWSGAELFQRLSVTREGALYWSTLASVGWMIIPVALFLFTLHYTRRTAWLRTNTVYVVLAITLIVFIYLNLSTGAFIPFTQAQLQATPWGFNSGVEAYFPIFLVWFEALYLTSVYFIYIYFYQAKQKETRYQAIIFMFGLLLPCVAGTITDGVLPIFGINIYPLSTILSSVNAAVTTYAILRYGLFSFNPATVAENILHTMEEGVIVLNPMYTVDYVNSRGLELIAYNEQDVIGLPMRHLFTSRYSQLKREVLDVLKHERFAHIEKTEIESGKGKKVPVSISAARVADESGGVRGYIVTLTDTTRLERSLSDLEESVQQIKHQNQDLMQLSQQLAEEKAGVSRQVALRTRELNKSRAQLVASINSLELGFIMVNTKQELVILNQEAIHMLSTIEQRLHHSSITISQPEKNVRDIENTFGKDVHLQKHVTDCLRDAKSVEVEEIMIKGFFYHLYITPIVMNRRVIGAVLIMQDETEAKVLERSKDEFFSIASHEMRTPLTAITGYAELIKGMYADKIADKKFKQMVEGISEGGQRMTRIVNDFLNMSRLEQGKLTIEVTELNITHLIQQTMQELQTLADQKNVVLRLVSHDAASSVVLGDSDRIKEVLINLIGNAIKFSDKGSIIISTELHHDNVQVRVHDHGLGILPENQQLLFRKFQQAGASLIARDTSNGTGLGLYISKLMIEGMGGTIFLESSAPNQGSTFSFTLPLAKPEHHQVP